MLAFVKRIGNVFEVAGSCYYKFPLGSLVRIDKRPSALQIDGTSTGGLSCWNKISEIEANSLVEATITFVEKSV